MVFLFYKFSNNTIARYGLNTSIHVKCNRRYWIWKRNNFDIRQNMDNKRQEYSIERHKQKSVANYVPSFSSKAMFFKKNSIIQSKNIFAKKRYHLFKKNREISNIIHNSLILIILAYSIIQTIISIPFNQWNKIFLH